MELFLRQQFELLLQDATGNFAERATYRCGGPDAALELLRTDPDGDLVLRAQFVSSFFEENLKLARHNAPFEFYDPSSPIYTSPRFLPPAKVERYAGYVKYALLVAVVGYYIVTRHLTVYRYVEPFWMYSREATPVLWAMLGVLLLATLVVRNLYCQIGRAHV